MITEKQFKRSKRYKEMLYRIMNNPLIKDQFRLLEYWEIRWRDISESKIFTKADKKYIRTLTKNETQKTKESH